MVRAPRLSGKELIKLLQSSGFIVMRVRGSHHFQTSGWTRYRSSVHASEIIGPGLLNKICRDAGITLADL